MKIYWVSCDLIKKCFFRRTMEEAQEECDFRMNEKDEPLDCFGDPKDEEDVYGNWFVETEDVPDEKFGTCDNDGEPKLPDQRDCSVGMVRKMRSCVPEELDDGTCKWCPYFIARGE